MTKVYLVYMNGIDTKGSHRKIVWAVFSNLRKAKIYCKYKKKVTDKFWLKTNKMKKAFWTLETEILWTEDFTIKLNKIQNEKLPF